MHINVNVFPIPTPPIKRRCKGFDGGFFFVLCFVPHLFFPFVKKIIHMECTCHVVQIHYELVFHSSYIYSLLIHGFQMLNHIFQYY
jgi:hypothetical protein